MADQPLHIAVDGRELLGQPTGVGRFLHAILREWSRPGFPHRLSIVGPAPAPAELQLPAHARWVAAPGRAGTWWEQTRLPAAVRRTRADVLFAPAYTAPLRRVCPYVLVVHDVSFCAHPEWFTAREGVRRRTLTRLAARRAHSVLTVSEFSAREIARWLGVPADRIRVARHGVPDLPSVPAAPRPPLVLFAGSLFNRRNIPALLEAFADVAARIPDARLVLAGDNRTSPHVDPLAMAGRLGVRDRVEWRAYVTDAELGRLYDEARVFTFLSDYEGFALTPLEALAHGTPSVLLDTPVAREVYGPGAALVPLDRTAIAGAISRLLEDEDARQALVEAGRERLARFSWRESAATVLSALAEAARAR